MATVFIIGDPGSGKTSSLQTMDRNTTGIINVLGKDFPFRGGFAHEYRGNNLQQIGQTLKTWIDSGEVKNIVLDDIGYVMTCIFMAKHRNMKGNQSFELYNDIADAMWNLVNFCKGFPRDINTYFMFHESTNDYGVTKIKTIGKLLDDKVLLDGMVTVVLRCMSKDGKHFVRTVTDGSDCVKAPMGLFAEEEIPNDLKLIDDCIRDFYGTQINKQEENSHA